MSLEIFQTIAKLRDDFEESFERFGLAKYAESPVKTPNRLKRFGGAFDQETITLFALWCGYRAHFHLVLVDAATRRDEDALVRHLESLHNFEKGFHKYLDQVEYVCVPSSSD